ncbi:protein translocase subunit SecDF [Bhargavaea ullalensis]|uniref:Multifunctional fusion protein n=1 Tax=Bhargavaea ullalensis TaxID=1265685 RepID=A0ABV2G9D3_9BACL
MKTRGRIVAFLLLLLLFAGTIGGTAKQVAKDVNLGLDLQGGFEVLYQVEPLRDGQKITEDVVSDTARALTDRIDVLGVSEPNLQVESGNRIRVQLAGIEDQESARELLSTQANLTFRDTNDRLLLDGDDLVAGGAKSTFNDQGQPIVTLRLKDASKFGEVTSEIKDMYPNNQLVIWLDFDEGKDSYAEEAKKPDPKFISAPNVSKTIMSSDVEISGSFTVDETKHLAGILNAGALPVKLHEIYSTSVGAQFGEQALNKTVFAAAIGIGIVLLFMLLYYRVAGFVAAITLSVYVYLVLLVFNLLNGTLTLPGIAAVVLGVGMAVDANILTYERIREELRIGGTVKEAFRAGSRSSFTAILDANVTTLLAAVVLFIFGTSSVKGFATMLILSILLSFLTAVWGSRMLLGLLVHSNILDGKPGAFGLSRKWIHPREEHVDVLELTTRFDRFDFAHNRKKFFTFSIMFLIAGAIILGVFKLNLGIDFTQGTRVEVLADSPMTVEQVEGQLEKIGHPSDDVVISGDNSDIAVIRYKDDFTQEQINKLKSDLSAQYGHDPNVSTVSPTVGRELAQNAVKALAIAMIGIIIYVAFRFEWRMGVASIVSLLHDAFFMIALFSLLRLEVDITFIAAILTIVGYSINDTIVTFDRIRENLHKTKKIETEEDLANVVNKSLRQTLGRSVNTVFTVLVVVLALMLFGAESIRNFSIALFVGLLAGTYSSIFIAAQLWLVLKKREIKKKGSLDVQKKEREWGSDDPVV